MQSRAQTSEMERKIPAGSGWQLQIRPSILRLGKLLDRAPPARSRAGPFDEDPKDQPASKDGAGALGREEGTLSRAGIDSSVWALRPDLGLSPESDPRLAARAANGRLAPGPGLECLNSAERGQKSK